MGNVITRNKTKFQVCHLAASWRDAFIHIHHSFVISTGGVAEVEKPAFEYNYSGKFIRLTVYTLIETIVVSSEALRKKSRSLRYAAR